MYHIGLIRPFRAQHFLIGGDWGAENALHSHDYRVEWTLGGPELDRHGYLLDLLAVEAYLDEAVERVRDRTLNDLAEFRGINPSVERLARLLSDWLLAARPRWDPDLRQGQSLVKVWEHDTAWASWSEALTGPGGPR